jgi:hypothetical protein
MQDSLATQNRSPEPVEGRFKVSAAVLGGQACFDRLSTTVVAIQPKNSQIGQAG